MWFNFIHDPVMFFNENFDLIENNLIAKNFFSLATSNRLLDIFPNAKIDRINKLQGIKKYSLVLEIQSPGSNAATPWEFTFKKIKNKNDDIIYVHGRDVSALREKDSIMKGFLQTIEDNNKIISRKSKEIKLIMENVNQGLCLINSNTLIEGEYSKNLEIILGSQDLSGKSVADLLIKKLNISEDKRNLLIDSLNFCFGEDYLSFESNKPHFIQEAIFIDSEKTIHLQMDWIPLGLEKKDVTSHFLLTIKDITDFIKIREENKKKEKELKDVYTILQIKPQKYLSYYQNFNDLFSEVLSIFKKTENVTKKEDWVIILRNLHTIKGNARALGFDNVSNMVHKIEDLCIFQLNDKNKINEDKLQEKHLTELKKEVDYYHEIYNRFRDSSDTQVINEIRKIVFTQHNFEDLEVDNILSRIKLILIHREYTSIDDILEEISTSRFMEDKKINFSSQTNKLMIKDIYREKFKSILLHLYNNSIDHGFTGKVEGTIFISLKRENNEINIHYYDDGLGLNIKKLKEKAVANGYYDLDMQKVAEQIFLPGLSTAESLSQTSGRGVGMDAVKGEIEKMKGQIEIKLGSYNEESGYSKFAFNINLPSNIFWTFNLSLEEKEK